MRTGAMPSLPNVDKASVVGRDKDIHRIISMLEENDDQQEIKIISIIGLGGSGKTTLAKLVFNYVNIINSKYFEVRLWIHVSQEFNVENIVRKMFEAFADNDPGQHALPYMSKKISDRLNGKRFLLVLDDVWTESRVQWEEFMVHIMGGAPGSRILLTARNREVAVTVGSINQFDLPFLSSNDSWQLFQQSFVMPATSWKSEFEEVGKEIVDKCGGVPLAIKILAGALRDMERIEEWHAVRDNNLSNVKGKDGIVAGCLRMSYFHLPSNLKQCFTICSVFPKCHKIDKEQLIDQWIAHDMITLADGVVDYLEYVGHKYFNSLVQVCFLQNVEEEDGRVTCEMHDLVHDFAQFILGDEISLVVPKEATSSTKSYRYFSLIEEPEPTVPSQIFGKTRAVYFAKCYDYIYGMALKHANHMRSVTVISPYVTALPKTVFQIQCLKFLAISRLNCEELPESISDLWSLQALHLTNSFYLVKVPESIFKLKKLRTLNLSGCAYLKSLPYLIGHCHMISSIDVSRCSELERLPKSIGKNIKLRVLRLCGTYKLQRLPSGITALENLECLNLRRCNGLKILPDGIGNLKKLEVLDLEGCINLRTFPAEIAHAIQVGDLKIFIVGQGEKSAQISELVPETFEYPPVRITTCVVEPDDAHKACLLKRSTIESLELCWTYTNCANKMDIEMKQAVLDDLEPPAGIKKLDINEYAGGGFAKWMLKQEDVGDHRVQKVPQFTCLTVMRLSKFPNLKHLEGLVEMPRLEVLELLDMPALENISGGPFASLAKLTLRDLPCLGEMRVIVVTDTSNLSGGEAGSMQIGTCLSDVHIEACPQLMVKPYIPSSLESLELIRSNEHLLKSPVQGSPSSSSFAPSLSYSHLKKLRLEWMAGSGREWELLQHMTALESLHVNCCDVLTELPESLWSLTSLRSLEVSSCSAIRMLPESIGELRCLEELTILTCPSLSNLPQSMGHLTSLRSLKVKSCSAISMLPESIGELHSLQKLSIKFCNSLSTIPQSTGHLTSLWKLRIESCDVLHQLPECLGELHSLRILRTSRLPVLTCLPQSMCGLTSLEVLKIFNCPGIKSLPEGIQAVTTLQELRIIGCPDLVRRYKRGNGEDSHLVSHIPRLLIL